MLNIACNLTGGLGNQLFQIFAAYAYSIRNNYDLIIPIKNKAYWYNILRHLKVYTTKKTLQYSIYEEPCFKFANLPTFKDNTILQGYFQSEKYFEFEYSRIIHAMQLRKQQNLIKNKYYYLFNEYTISIHLRRGDYCTVQKFHPLVPFEHYESALKIINKNCKVLCFCDSTHEIQPLINHLSKQFSMDFITIDSSIPDWKQLLLMSCCNDNIIANSTFSWWAAYFNENPIKKVYYPKKWFGPALSHDTSTLFPVSWQQIDY